ncbi:MULTISPECIES: biofilm peroxide resistance protein BsmA [Tenebrionibacter/Tenebrionicola group]|jgi:hypothetical protein|uniref:Biofilm peroxide resistance protein BsmA n=2 Tax=Tenebrionibacter/Tenebrionicola group TaxID=2969848 RepID=A0A8K0V1Y5_9ENTR|nr:MULTISPECIES: biofilm peroxide resistance protein BsmA [Tenebrionibacter/Tenebrionicola group]MBK4715974.1 biofilm peroxide resistance protein BsmA [Tenebrionibacter intestinalis]MBV4413589.1 biofilm peroxide resistance protein BsmA [Tenebrionicola larvae]MBV5096141.1 biofilm peroxide resistance protein BsmA [Tenebrionicola larvae]
MKLRWLPLSALMLPLLTACSALQSAPQPAPAASGAPQEVQRSQTQGLKKIGTVSAIARGAPSDGEAAIRAKATAAQASYYLIVVNDETVVPGQWYTQAILYR